LRGLSAHTPFRLIHTDNKEPQSQRQFGDKGDPWKIRDRQCEEEPEAVDPVSHAGSHHQQAENCRKKLRPKDEEPEDEATVERLDAGAKIQVELQGEYQKLTGE
jgi:hypothetical protein